jgi:hypothetical protein
VRGAWIRVGELGPVLYAGAGREPFEGNKRTRRSNGFSFVWISNFEPWVEACGLVFLSD